MRILAQVFYNYWFTFIPEFKSISITHCLAFLQAIGITATS